MRKGAYAIWIGPKDWQIQAWKTQASNGVRDFIHTYVHDSKVGFINNAEPFSYFSQRGVSESSRSVYGWAEYNVSRPVDHAVESTVDYASEKAQQAKDVAVETAGKVKDKANQAVDYASDKANQAWDATTDAAQRAKGATIEAAKQTKQAVSSAAQKAVDTASQVKQSVGQATQNALNKLDSAWKEIWQ
ncbi:MAG: hypothetical protein GAK30_02304 [Paracidovorax wautersii]|uniref:Uncharacterized protein n=1 Tax=Paracidovorax wautersii TaxID=1177982 RepID=A0A7V8FNB8_9BURK|nr:MAG: hypothetical protein GAK30_02304 [Paracidovorax wautersii]